MNRYGIPIPWRVPTGRLIVLCLLFLVAACGGGQPVRPGATYTVKRGDTLYAIATRYGLDYRDVARWNGIGRGYLIHPGQVLFLVPSKRTAMRSSESLRTTASQSPAPDPAAAVLWSWPVEPQEVMLTTRPNSSQGLTMTGQLGQVIRSAAAGSVVYVGAGLLGYGQLVIIKHNDTYLSAYGHTQSVSIQEGEVVNPGQPIATMGEGPGQRAMLYFEIRVNGQPVDPAQFLPRK